MTDPASYMPRTSPPQRQSPPRQREQQRQDCGGRRRLVDREHAAVDADENPEQQRKRGRCLPRRVEALRPRHPRPDRRDLRPPAHDNSDGDQVERDRDQRRHDRCNEHIEDESLRDHAVDDHHQRGRDQRFERAARGDHSGRERRRIAAFQHLRQGDLGKCGGGRGARAADRAEGSRTADRGVGEPAATMAEKRRRGAIDVLGEARHARKHAHEQKQRHGRKVRACEHIGRLLGEERERRQPAAALQRESDDADRHHREADRNLQQDQRKQRGDPQCADHRRCQIVPLSFRRPFPGVRPDDRRAGF